MYCINKEEIILRCTERHCFESFQLGVSHIEISLESSVADPVNFFRIRICGSGF